MEGETSFENARDNVIRSLKGLLRSEEYELVGQTVQLLAVAMPDVGRAIERRMPAMILNNSPVFVGERAMASIRWRDRTPDWHDQLRRHAASPKLDMTVRRIAAEIDSHEGTAQSREEEPRRSP